MFRRGDPLRPKLLRGAVVQALYVAVITPEEPLNAADPFTLPRGVVARILEMGGFLPSRAELNAAVRYLDEKGYVEATWEEGEWTRIRLTTKGIDLVEGSLQDAGVILPRR